MNIVIVGQGAMGLLWHNHMQTFSANVASISLLPSPKQSQQAANNKTVTIEYSYTHLNGLSEQCNYQLAQISQLNNADVILVCVKSYQVKQVLADISDKLNKHAIIILAHNGMGTLHDIAHAILDQHTILALLTTHGCARPMPKHIIHTGLGQSDLGILSGRLSANITNTLTELFNKALPPVHWQENIIAKQWQKLAVNCVINPLTALYNIDNGEINSAVFSDLKVMLITELVQVAKAENFDFIATDLLNLVNQVATTTARNCSSMRTDILAKRTTEIDYINGYIHRLGLKHHISTPQNSQLLQQIKMLGQD